MANEIAKKECSGASVTMECAERRCISIKHCAKVFGVSAEEAGKERDMIIGKWSDEVGEEVPPEHSSCCFGN